MLNSSGLKEKFDIFRLLTKLMNKYRLVLWRHSLTETVGN